MLDTTDAGKPVEQGPPSVKPELGKGKGEANKEGVPVKVRQQIYLCRQTRVYVYRRASQMGFQFEGLTF